MEKSLETAWVCLEVGWGAALGNHQGGATSVRQVDQVSDMVALWKEISETEQWLLCAAGQFSSSLYVYDTFQSAAPMLQPRVSKTK